MINSRRDSWVWYVWGGDYCTIESSGCKALRKDD